MTKARRTEIEICLHGDPRDGDLPEGWAAAELPDIARITMGQSPPGRTYNEVGDGMPFFQGKADFGAVYPTVRKWCSAPNKISKNGDVLMSIRAPVGPTNIANQTCAIGRGLAAISPMCAIPTEFLLYALRLQEGELAAQGTGSTFTAISRSHLNAILVALPPLAEQKRIVAKVRELLARVNAARERLAKVALLVRRFRESVLAAACAGQLTSDWREMNPCDETGGDLLKRIKSLRLRKAQSPKEAQQVDAAFAEGVSAVSDEELGVDRILADWTRCRIGTIGIVCNGSTPARKHPEFWDGKIPWISSGEVRNNVIMATRERITQHGFDNSSVRLLPRGTVLLAMIGEGKTRGQSALLGIEATINQNIAAIIVSHGLLHPEFLWRWFQMRYDATREQGGGSGPQALNCQRVRELPFVLPPLAEQREIVCRVESRVALATARVEKITQAILAQAFRGELIPTEAELARQEGRSYEPAVALLQRIRTERGAADIKDVAVKPS